MNQFGFTEPCLNFVRATRERDGAIPVFMTVLSGGLGLKK